MYNEGIKVVVEEEHGKSKLSMSKQIVHQSNVEGLPPGWGLGVPWNSTPWKVLRCRFRQ